MSGGDNILQVDTRPTKRVVVDSLTRDATVRASVFDLIDNSIDAARDTIFSELEPHEEHLLPASYRSFEISLELSGTKLKIKDNCGGISHDHLKSMVLRFGERSDHELGIGVFGVGLNRALFKLGQTSTLTTDTGLERAELVLDVPTYLMSDNWFLPAQKLPSSGKRGTVIEITDLPAGISKDFADREWVQDLTEEIGRRYGQFISKGLAILVDSSPVPAKIMEIRQNSPFPGEYKIFHADNGVSVHLEYGQLRDHRFSNEIGYDKVRNSQITDDYGWTVICNDRVILMSDRSLKTGWDSGFHTEFYGFAGIARFVSADPANLPWKTTKTDVDLNNEAYLLALVDMRRFASMWRTTVEKRKKGSAKGEKIGELPPAPAAPSPPTPSAKRKAKTRPGKQKPPIIKPDHHQYREVLPPDLNEIHCTDKLLALVHEGRRVDVYRDPYTSLALLRMLFETSGVHFLIRHGKADEIKQFVVGGYLARGLTLTDKEKDNAFPSMDELLAFLDKNQSIWGATKGPLRHSLTKMKTHQKIFNSVLHGPFQMVPQNLALNIRDEITPILRHLIET